MAGGTQRHVECATIHSLLGSGHSCADGRGRVREFVTHERFVTQMSGCDLYLAFARSKTYANRSGTSKIETIVA